MSDKPQFQRISCSVLVSKIRYCPTLLKTGWVENFSWGFLKLLPQISPIWLFSWRILRWACVTWKGMAIFKQLEISWVRALRRMFDRILPGIVRNLRVTGRNESIWKEVGSTPCVPIVLQSVFGHLSNTKAGARAWGPSPLTQSKVSF